MTLSHTGRTAVCNKGDNGYRYNAFMREYQAHNDEGDEALQFLMSDVGENWKYGDINAANFELMHLCYFLEGDFINKPEKSSK